MEQLLSIKTIPISVEIVIENAQLKYNNKLPKVEVSRQQGGLQMKAEPIKVNIDTFEMRQSIGLKSINTVINEFGNQGIKLAYEATAKIVQEGNQLAHPKGMDIAQIAASRMNKQYETVLDFLPKVGPEISWDGGTLSVHYQMDKLDMDWDLGNTNFEFIPGKIQVEVKELPRVEIEYLGGPIYVPPSADPSYIGKEIDIKA